MSDWGAEWVALPLTLLGTHHTIPYANASGLRTTDSGVAQVELWEIVKSGSGGRETRTTCRAYLRRELLGDTFRTKVQPQLDSGKNEVASGQWQVASGKSRRPQFRKSKTPDHARSSEGKKNRSAFRLNMIFESETHNNSPEHSSTVAGGPGPPGLNSQEAQSGSRTLVRVGLIYLGAHFHVGA